MSGSVPTVRYLNEIVAVGDVGFLQGADPAGDYAPNLEPEATLALDPLEASVQRSVQRGQLVQLAKH